MRTFESVEELIRSGPPGRAVVVEPYAREAVEAIVDEVREFGTSAYLVGDESRIRSELKALHAGSLDIEVMASRNSAHAVATAVELVKEGCADFVVKGSLATATLLQGMLGRDRLGTGRVASHLYVIEAPAYRGRMIAITDAGVNIHPDLVTKADIIRNSIDALRLLGIDIPKVAVLSAVELVKPDLASATDAALLAVMGRRGQLGRLEIDGPLSIDAAMMPAAARDKSLTGAVAGQADLLVAPEINAANMTSKALIGEIGRAMGVVLGTQVPIALPSRGDSLETRRLSLGLVSYLALQSAERIPMDAAVR